MRHYSTVVIGGGAAGIMAAGIAAATGRKVLLCERMEKPQRKVRITGKGRCNLTNLCSEEEFLSKVRSGADFVRYAWQQFDSRAVMQFFEQIGVPLSVERGRRVFPTSGRAWDVAEAHIAWCRQQGVEIITHTRVEELHTRNKQISGITVRYNDGSTEQIACQTAILTTGGASYPATGSTGDGYRLAHQLGHTIVPIRPSLTPLIADRPTPKPLIDFTLRNISAQLYIDGKKAAEEFGELTFTPLGVGGAIVLRLSRQAVDALIDERKVELRLDLKPALTAKQLEARVEREKNALSAKTPLRQLLAKLVPSVMIAELARRSQLDPNRPMAPLTDSDRQRLIGTLKAWRIPLTDYAPFREAIVTAGGVCTDEVDPLTMQSKLIRGLYFAGEVLDIDANTGGYNLQLAYSTGHLAGNLNA